ncbi:MAG TPA: methyltransferase domain-containing protein [Polyangiaceae bacterium]|nr:methyltransferase domain-containing protein [Polyangiaceae bacterium]
MTTSFAHDTPLLAQTYDRLSDFQFESGKRLLDRLGLKSGEHVLDVGCGTGRLACWIAERVGAAGRVAGIDPLPERVAIARTRGVGIEFEVGQAENLGAFAPESFDIVCLSAVLHWVSDKPRALAQIRRVLRPGGRVGASTLPRELLEAGTVAAVLIPILRREPYAPRVDLSAFALARRGHTTTELISMVMAAGLDLVEVSVGTRSRSLRTGKDVVDMLESSSFGNFLCLVPEELREALRGDLEAAFDARRGPDGIVLHDWGTRLIAARV